MKNELMYIYMAWLYASLPHDAMRYNYSQLACSNNYFKTYLTFLSFQEFTLTIDIVLRHWLACP